ncbi:LPS export ABC transporter periplasmic protein LptC [Candidatus Pelagibacter communis]|uniref:LPS export ABC transporter periplasmic protein LptC n=1 Tax=Pelagibacter ubique TaxID=198252 RepID=UPI00094D5B04|nr:LPS export ABC transporter periplasmic protein LptC [Candidatus Pelagibacter ubique]
MNKKIYIQISLIFLVIFIIIFIYIYYFSSSKTKITENDKEKTEVNTVQGTDDLIKEMFYYSEDNKGNKYEIKSEYGIISPDKSNLILMDKVTAIIYLLNGEKIFISSKKAEYDDDNNNTSFSGSVELLYVNHVIKSDNMYLSFNEQTASLYDNVEYKSTLSNLTADRVFINLINKNTKIQMNDANNNILVRSIINNGNN